MAKVIQVIVTENGRGAGVIGDPYRNVPQYWDFDGELLAEKDDFDKNEAKVLVLNESAIKLLHQREDLVNVLMAVMDGPAGKRAIRIDKARKMASEVLDTIK